MSKKYYKVAVNSPFNNSVLTYTSNLSFTPGSLVEVPLGKRLVQGCVLEMTDDPQEEFELKSISGITDENLDISEELSFYVWISKYYHYPVGQLISDILPKILKRPREIEKLVGTGNGDKLNLENEQITLWNELNSVSLNNFSKKLIHGVTGSGKSILYLKMIEKVLAKGSSVLFLVPEINLTPQFVSFFKEHLSVPIYLYHSDISNSEKYKLWTSLSKETDPSLLIGVRSSVFIPFKNLGLIVVDEEHDSSFKQEDRCPYNARDLAIKRSQLKGIPIILGSATPTVENYVNFKKSSEKLNLERRYSSGSLPMIDLVDLRKAEYGKDFEHWPIPQASLEKIRERLDSGEQVIVFINKLGFASYVQCRSCGHTFECPNCTVSLTMFKHKRVLSCHSCGYEEPTPDVCPECQNMNLLNKGFGTEKVKEVLSTQLKDFKVERFDRDEIKTTKQLVKALDDFHGGNVDVLVGTQMLSKGHNFKKVNLVLVLGIDSQLNFPDYRANERTYQLLTQISGRSGRFGKESEVLVHTHSPDNEIFGFIKDHSFDAFYEKELMIRKACMCPPYLKMAVLYFNGKNKENLIKDAEDITSKIKNLIEKHFNDVFVMGPRPSVVEKRANRFTWVTLLKSSNLNDLHNLINTIQESSKLKSGNTIKIDIDPMFVV